MRVAAMDLGTNSARLAVADADDRGAWRLVVDERIPCRLGQDLARTGCLHPEAEVRALEALATLVKKARAARAERLRIVATHAVRSASNGAAFAARARRACGVDLEILSGEAEARLVLRAARRWAPPEARAAPLVCLDLGGGSLELARDVDPPELVSLPLGAVVLSSALLTPAAQPALAALRRDVAAHLAREASAFAGASRAPVAAGGTATTAARILDPARPVAGRRLDAPDLEALLLRLAPLDVEARRRVPGLEPDRADIIVPGLAVLCETLRFVEATALVVHAQGIREGLILEMLEAG